LIWQREHLVYGTRLEVQWASSRTRGLVPEFGAIGVQLQAAHFQEEILLRAAHNLEQRAGVTGRKPPLA